MLVLSAQGKIDFPIHLFCNVGDDSENPDTLAYIDKVSKPYAQEHGIELIELYKITRSKEPLTLLESLAKPNTRSIGIPVRMADTGSPGNRKCTFDFKLKVMDTWLRTRGVTKDRPAITAVGISTDEIQRANRGKGTPLQNRVHPLLDLGLSRNDCRRLITEAGLPMPPKSSCYFCPFKRPQEFAEMRRDDPELFERAAQVEDLVNRTRDRIGADHVYLTRYGRPIREAVGPAQDQLFADDSGMDDGECDEGVCFV
jgi:hypothetical protein